MTVSVKIQMDLSHYFENNIDIPVYNIMKGGYYVGDLGDFRNSVLGEFDKVPDRIGELYASRDFPSTLHFLVDDKYPVYGFRTHGDQVWYLDDGTMIGTDCGYILFVHKSLIEPDKEQCMDHYLDWHYVFDESHYCLADDRYIRFAHFYLDLNLDDWNRKFYWGRKAQETSVEKGRRLHEEARQRRIAAARSVLGGPRKKPENTVDNEDEEE